MHGFFHTVPGPGPFLTGLGHIIYTSHQEKEKEDALIKSVLPQSKRGSHDALLLPRMGGYF